MKPKYSFLQFLKKAVWPLTPVVVVFIGAFIFNTYLFYQTYVVNPDVGLLMAVVGMFSVPLIFMYAFDRLLVGSLSYPILAVIELMILALMGLGIKQMTASNQIQIETDQAYVLVVFDRQAGAIQDFSQFKRTGLFEKKQVVRSPLILIDPNFYQKNEVSIHYPKHWKSFNAFHESIDLNNRMLSYIICYQYPQHRPQERNDSIIQSYLTSFKP